MLNGKREGRKEKIQKGGRKNEKFTYTRVNVHIHTDTVTHTYTHLHIHKSAPDAA